MKHRLKRIDGTIIAESDSGTFADLVVANKADLHWSDLRWSDLRGSDLHWSDLRWSDLRGANLNDANLSGASLSGADLYGANLIGANLSDANLSGASLSGASLICASLRWANLSGADLSGANLSGANLDGAILTDPVARLDFGGWSICVRDAHTSIGCQNHANDKWLAWTPESEEIREMHPDASAWWAIHGEAVKAVIRCVMAKRMPDLKNSDEVEL